MRKLAFSAILSALAASTASADAGCDHNHKPTIEHLVLNKYISTVSVIDAVYFYESALSLDGDSEAATVEKRMNDALVRAGAHVRISVINGGPRVERATGNGSSLFSVFESEREAGVLDGYEADVVIFRAAQLADEATGAPLAGSARPLQVGEKLGFFRLSNAAGDSTAPHEFGHVLGLGHSDPFLCANRPDVMKSSATWDEGLFYVSSRYSRGGQSCGRNGSATDDVDLIDAAAPAVAALFPNDEPGSLLSVSVPVVVSEGQSLEATVSRAGDVSEPASVRVRVIANESATSQIAQSAIVSFAAGESVKTINLPVPADNLAEAEEKAIILLDDAVGAGYAVESAQHFTINASQAQASGGSGSESGGGGGGSFGLLGLLIGFAAALRRKIK